MFKKMSTKISIKLKLFVLMQIFFDKDRKSCNRKPRNGKPRKTRDYCNNFEYDKNKSVNEKFTLQ